MPTQKQVERVSTLISIHERIKEILIESEARIHDVEISTGMSRHEWAELLDPSRDPLTEIDRRTNTTDRRLR